MKKTQTRTGEKAIVELSEKDLAGVAGGRRLIVEDRGPPPKPGK